jgi:hypothetical protein
VASLLRLCTALSTALITPWFAVAVVLLPINEWFITMIGFIVTGVTSGPVVRSSTPWPKSDCEPSGTGSPPIDSKKVRKSNQVNFGAFRGSFIEPAPRSSSTKPPDAAVGVDWTATRGVAAGEEGFEPSIS